jgi:hypothetical protein
MQTQTHTTNQTELVANSVRLQEARIQAEFERTGLPESDREAWMEDFFDDVFFDQTQDMFRDLGLDNVGAAWFELEAIGADVGNVSSAEALLAENRFNGWNVVVLGCRDTQPQTVNGSTALSGLQAINEAIIPPEDGFIMHVQVEEAHKALVIYCD